MPLKRTPRAQRETPAARALRAAVAEATDAMIRRISDDGETTAQRLKGEKRARKFAARVMRDGLDAAMEREAVKRASEPSRPTGDVYAAHHATAVRSVAEASATRAAAATEEATTDDEPDEPKPRRKRRPAGFAGYIDPRLFDSDDWED